MKFKAAIFDLDNTLYNYSNCHHEALKTTWDYMIANSSVEPDLLPTLYTYINLHFKHTLGGTAASHNRFLYFKMLVKSLHLPWDLVENLHNCYWHKFFSTMVLFDRVLDLLNFLQEKSVDLYILSDFQCEKQFEKLKQLDILNFWKDIITSEEVGIEKPLARMFNRCLQDIKYTPQEIVMIGDDYQKDIVGSSNLGIYGLHFQKGSPLTSHDNYTIFGNFTDLKTFF